MEKHEQVHRSKKDIILNNFLGGVAWAFGTVFGFAIIAVIIGYLFRNVNLVPLIGNFVAGVTEYAITKNSGLFIK